jgi:hypothetical protein
VQPKTEPIPRTLIHYTDEAVRDLCGARPETLADIGTSATIAARLLRLELEVAEAGKLSRQSRYQAFPLTGQGNPTAKTMFVGKRASGLQLSFAGA